MTGLETRIKQRSGLARRYLPGRYGAHQIDSGLGFDVAKVVEIPDQVVGIGIILQREAYKIWYKTWFHLFQCGLSLSRQPGHLAHDLIADRLFFLGEFMKHERLGRDRTFGMTGGEILDRRRENSHHQLLTLQVIDP